MTFSSIIFWLFRSKENGQPVPAPRTVSFEPGGDGQTSDTTEEQTVTIAPEQVERGGIKIETVGETLSQASASVSSTGVASRTLTVKRPSFHWSAAWFAACRRSSAKTSKEGKQSPSFSATN